MALSPGSRIGPYEVVSAIGSGGMGEVARARDARLGRDVAIKSLPEAFAHDPERVARFEREARLLASLDHPNLAAIHGLEEVDGQRYLVLEFVDGETLAERIARGRLPVPDALEVCRQIANAIEAAHESGVVHRDLKPGNVMIARSGAVKVLDFGLAKATGAGAGIDPSSASPTVTDASTEAGVILGTAPYRSPEQARGRPVDKRTDIWSFGCVLFECLSGKPCFEGETASDLIAAVLHGEPAWETLPPDTPARVLALLHRCLDKDARRRLRDMGEARIELEDALAESGSKAASPRVRSSVSAPEQGPRILLWGALLAIAGAAIALAAWSLLHRRPASPVAQFEITDPEPAAIQFVDPEQMALSPDGSMLAFIAGKLDSMSLWVRDLHSITSRKLPGTDGALLPFWSPDGRSIGFFTDSKLMRIAASGGEATPLCDVKLARGGTWGRAGDIVFAANSQGPLSLVPAGGGDPRPLTQLAPGETGHRFPQFLPDGRHFIYASIPPRDGLFDIMVGDVRGGAPRKLMTASTGVAVGAGVLLYRKGAKLIAQPFDAGRCVLTGAATTLQLTAAKPRMSGSTPVSAAANGAIAYRAYHPQIARLAWADLEGRETAAVPVEPAPYRELRNSPDDRFLALTFEGEDGFGEVRVCDLARGFVSRLSDEPGCSNPTWSPDGQRLAYLTGALAPQHIVIRSVHGTAPPETHLTHDPVYKELYGWTPDGGALIVSRQTTDMRWDLGLVPLDSTQAPRALVSTPFNEQGGWVSPDGRWLAYLSDESGRVEAYVKAFPGGGATYPVTKGGVYGVSWEADGRKLGVVLQGQQGDYDFMVADVLPGTEFRLGPLHRVARVPGQVIAAGTTHDLKREILLLPAGKPQVNTIAVLTDWRAAATGR